MGAVQHKSTETLFNHTFRGTAFQVTNPLPRRREFRDTSDKSWPVKECGSPECGNITVAFDKCRPFCQVLHDRGQRDDGSAGEWLDEHLSARTG